MLRLSLVASARAAFFFALESELRPPTLRGNCMTVLEVTKEAIHI